MEEVIAGHGAYDDEIRNTLDLRYDAAVTALRCELEDALARLSRPAANATWEATQEFKQFIVTVAQLKHLFGGHYSAPPASWIRRSKKRERGRKKKQKAKNARKKKEKKQLKRQQKKKKKQQKAKAAQSKQKSQQAARTKAIQGVKKEDRWKHFWTWPEEINDVTLAAALIDLSSEGSCSAEGEAPEHLHNVFTMLFEVTDRNQDGSLSTIELMNVLKKRAKGTALDGNSHAVFTLKDQLHEIAEDDHAISKFTWEKGIMATMRKDENGAVTQWVLRELQNLACDWTTQTSDEHDGAEYYHNDTTEEQTWVKPPALAALQRLEEIITDAGHPLSISDDDDSLSAAVISPQFNVSSSEPSSESELSPSSSSIESSDEEEESDHRRERNRKYPSQTSGALPEEMWRASIEGVRLGFNPVKIDLTPIDTSLCSSFAQSIGSDRFAQAAAGTIFEREQSMMRDMQHELAGKYRSYDGTTRTTQRTKENELEQLKTLCVSVGEVTMRSSFSITSLRSHFSPPLPPHPLRVALLSLARGDSRTQMSGGAGRERKPSIAPQKGRRRVGSRRTTVMGFSTEARKEQPKWLRVKRLSLSDSGDHVHKHHAKQRRASMEGDRSLLWGTSKDAAAMHGGEVTPPLEESIGEEEEEEDASAYLQRGPPPPRQPSTSVNPLRATPKINWSRSFSTSQQKYYWKCKESGEHSWEEPEGWTLPVLPADWKEHHDKESKAHYYSNRITGEITWQRPEPEELY